MVVRPLARNWGSCKATGAQFQGMWRVGPDRRGSLEGRAKQECFTRPPRPCALQECAKILYEEID